MKEFAKTFVKKTLDDEKDYLTLKLKKTTKSIIMLIMFFKKLFFCLFVS